MRALLPYLIVLIVLGFMFPWVRRRLTMTGFVLLSGFAIFLIVVSLTSLWRH